MDGLNQHGPVTDGDKDPSAEDTAEPGFNIQAVQRLTGVPSETLRAWERRYGVPKPRRAPNGQRVYSPRDLEVVRWLRQQTEHGLTVKRAVEQFRQDPDAIAQPTAQSFDPKLLMDGLVEAAMHFDVTGTERVLSHALAAHPLDLVCLEVVQPALVEIGDRWHRGEITPAVEHFSSTLIRRRLEHLAALMDTGLSRPLVVVGAAPGELHDIGALVFSILLRRRGIAVVFLGQDVPLQGALEVAERLKPDLLCLSASGIEAAHAITKVAQALEALGPEAPTLAFGGQAFIVDPDLVQSTPGAYLGKTADEAALAAERLVRPGVTV